MDKKKVLKTYTLHLRRTLLMNRKIENREEKILEFNKFADKCRHIEENLNTEVEAKIISIDEVREKKKRMKKQLEKLVLELHPYSIAQMNGKDTRWYTVVKREGENRKTIKKNTYEEIIDFLVEFYDVSLQKPKYTLRTMYPVWIRYKQSSTTKPSYIKRIHADWVRYYLNDPIIDVSLTKMTSNQITEWLNRKITVDGMTDKKKFYNMITIFKNIFAYCYEENIISENTFLRANYQKNLFEDKAKPKAETQVFTEDERNLIVDFALEQYQSNPRAITYLAIAFLFQTGLRSGEVVALETTDYDRENKTLYIGKSECKSFEFVNDEVMKYSGVFIGNPKKTASKRLMKLSDEACDILDIAIQSNKDNGVSDGNYIFVYNNRRIQCNSLEKRIKKICDRLDLLKRSPHKIRKTVLSELVTCSLNKNISDISSIREYAGHVDENTLLRNYVFSTKGSEMNTLVNTALQTKNYQKRHSIPKAKEA